MHSFMMRVALPVALCAMAVHTSPLWTAEPPSEAEALRKLAESGSVLSKLHRVQFTLRFPSEEAAAQAVTRLDELAFSSTIEPDDASENWAVLASKRMYPKESDLEGLRDKLREVAAEGRGTYEGWSAVQLDS